MSCSLFLNCSIHYCNIFVSDNFSFRSNSSKYVISSGMDIERFSLHFLNQLSPGRVYSFGSFLIFSLLRSIFVSFYSVAKYYQTLWNLGGAWAYCLCAEGKSNNIWPYYLWHQTTTLINLFGCLIIAVSKKQEPVGAPLPSCDLALDGLCMRSVSNNQQPAKSDIEWNARSLLDYLLLT